MRHISMTLILLIISGCASHVSDRPCPRVTEFPEALQAEAADELLTAPALRRMMDAMAADRAFNRAVCR
jgi:hypothetical protein